MPLYRRAAEKVEHPDGSCSRSVVEIRRQIELLMHCYPQTYDWPCDGDGPAAEMDRLLVELGVAMRNGYR